jgi:hypothetical protein
LHVESAAAEAFDGFKGTSKNSCFWGGKCDVGVSVVR